jgi:Cu/Ag efflux protein CusF
VEINPLTGEALKIKLIDKDKRREEAKARGTVIKVDAAAKKLTVRLPDKSEIIVTITNATELEVDGRHAALADIKEGDAVKLEYDPQTMVALEVEVKKTVKDKEQARPEPRRGERAKVEGTITAVDPAKGTLTIFTKNGETRVITIRPDTAMAFNDKRISALSELPLAAAVKVEHTEGNVAIKIEAKKSEADIRGKDSENDKGRDTGGKGSEGNKGRRP